MHRVPGPGMCELECQQLPGRQAVPATSERDACSR